MENGKMVAKYTIKVGHEEKTWKIKKTFADFRELDRKVGSPSLSSATCTRGR